jgi:hypothetical protein
VHPSDWLALAAFVLSLVAFGSTTSLTWLRWPRIVVDVTSRNNNVITPGSEDGGMFDEITVAVINSGAEPITVRSIGLAVVTMPDGTPMDQPNFMYDYESMVSVRKAQVPLGADLPTRVEAHDVKLWVFRNEMLGMIPGGAEVIGYADRYKTFRFWPHCSRDIIKRSTSQRQAKRYVDHVRRQPE